MSREKLYQWTIPALALIVLVGLVIYLQKDKVLGIGSKPSIASAILVGTGEPTAANFVPSYINNATTTYKFNTEGADTLNLELYSSVASSTTDTVGFEVMFSDNGTNFFAEDVNTTTGITTTHQPRIRAWTPGKTASSTKIIQITDINSKYIRIGFASWGINHTATSSDIALWARYILNKPF